MTAGGVACTTCGTEVSVTAKFCSECGAPIRATAKPAEYKQVTVLFTDVVRSMDIAAAVGAERLREIMAELADRCAAVVQRYGGTVDKFTGDGIMAVFGAPVALEDHAVRACLAALGIQEVATRLAADAHDRDGIDLQMRVGLNSGQVIAGEIGSGPFGYTAVGEQVGMAQRMESVAPSGGVVLSESTARLVESVAMLGEPEMVRIKGAVDPVPARRLLSTAAHGSVIGSADATLVGREWEMTTITGALDRSINSRGCVVGVAGPPGIGKTRLVRETAATARSRGVEVFSTYCESHACDVPLHVAARLLREVAGVSGLDDVTARAQVRVQVPDADPEDLLLVDDFLGINEPGVEPPNIDPDARRRRLSALINAATLARTQPALFIIDDIHWIDEVSESVLADFFTVVPRSPSLVLITYRPEYHGALVRGSGAQTISLAPLTVSESSALVTELIGTDPSVQALGATVVERADGNPFFAEAIVRDLAERGVFQGERGAYTCRVETADVTVPATLQAAIAARIDRLGTAAKRTLNAAAVIGSCFDTETLALLGIDAELDELMQAELIDQLRFTPKPEHGFHHPLIRAVAYESQLKSDRAAMHRRLASVIESQNPSLADENASLIAEHLDAAGDMHAAYGWHMRAGAWSMNRDIAAARVSLERACQIADSLPKGEPSRTAMRIAPRTFLCSSAWRVHIRVSDAGFEEFRELCAEAGDKASLAVAMAGQVMGHAFEARPLEASQLATELMSLLESLGDRALTVGIATAPLYAKIETSEMAEAARLAQFIIDLADGDATLGSNFAIGSPLAWAHVVRGFARFALGIGGWREDFDHAVALARGTDALMEAVIVDFATSPAIAAGALLSSDAALRDVERALRIAERSSDDIALSNAIWALAFVLMEREPPDRERGLQLLEQVREMAFEGRFSLAEVPQVDMYAARDMARRGDVDGAIQLVATAIDQLFKQGHPSAIFGTRILVDMLLDRRAEGDLESIEAAIEQLAAAPAGALAIGQIDLLRMRALLARARGDEVTYQELVARYRDMATSLGFEGHMAWAEAMP